MSADIDIDAHLHAWRDKQVKIAESTIEQDRALISDYFKTYDELGLTIEEYAPSRGISPTTMRRKLKQYNITIERFDGKHLQKLRNKPHIREYAMSNNCQCKTCNALRQYVLRRQRRSQ